MLACIQLCVDVKKIMVLFGKSDKIRSETGNSPVVMKAAARGREGGGLSKGLPQSPAWLRIVQVLQGFQGNLDKDRNTLKVSIRESAPLLKDVSSMILQAPGIYSDTMVCSVNQEILNK